MLNKFLKLFKKNKINKKQNEILDMLIKMYGSKDKIPEWRMIHHGFQKPEQINDPISYIDSKFDENIHEIPFVNILIETLSRDEYSWSQQRLDDLLNNIKYLVNIGKTTSIPNSMFEGIFKSLTEENVPYISPGSDPSDFQKFLNGLNELGYERWWKYQNDEYVGYTKKELILLKGEPESKTEKISRNKKREEFYYEGFKNRLGNQSYNLKIVLIEGKVENWTRTST